MKTIISCFAIVAIFLLFTIPVKLYALNYTISFTGTGASTSVESVVVQNLTKGTTVTVPTGNVLILSDVATSIDKVSGMTNGITIYPNPIKTKSTVTFFAKQSGTSQIDVFGIDGKKIIGLSSTLAQGSNSFQLSLPKGNFTVQVQGTGFSYNTKVISQMISSSKPEIKLIGKENSNITSQQKSKSSATSMIYSLGDQIVYKGISGNYSTIVTDKPIGSKTTNFEFVECKDGDGNGNNYTIVRIGTQLWMAENLKTTKYNDHSDIPLVTVNKTWSSLVSPSYCWYNNDVNYKSSFGALYNWYTVSTGKLAPLGWHIASNAEWLILNNYLIANGFNYDETTTDNKIAKSLASRTGWANSSIEGAIGNNSSKNNSSGFTAMSGGCRSIDGSYYLNGYLGYWWSSTETVSSNVWSTYLDSEKNYLGNTGAQKNNAFSVRCVKD